eukprot:g55172.t1
MFKTIFIFEKRIHSDQGSLGIFDKTCAFNHCVRLRTLVWCKVLQFIVSPGRSALNPKDSFVKSMVAVRRHFLKVRLNLPENVSNQQRFTEIILSIQSSAAYYTLFNAVHSLDIERMHG